MFKDDDHVVDAASRYPTEYLVGSDESVDEVKITLLQLRNILVLKKSKVDADPSYQEALIVKDIFFKYSTDGVHMTKEECFCFLQDYIRQVKRTAELSSVAFEEIYPMIDGNGNGMISKEELAVFVTKFSSSRHLK